MPRCIGSGRHGGGDFIAIECKTCGGNWTIIEGVNGYDIPASAPTHCPGCGQSILGVSE